MGFIKSRIERIALAATAQRTKDGLPPDMVKHLEKALLDDQLLPLERAMLHLDALSGSFYPHKRAAGGYVVLDAPRPDSTDLPIPPVPHREGYGINPDFSPNDEVYLTRGKEQIDFMKAKLAADGFVLGPGMRALEFGCSTARMLRWFQSEAASAECWGVDVGAPAIEWAQANLSPPFHFAVTTTAPHLPFPDGYFDLIYAGSVFTHIGELADAWLLELRRLLSSRGRIYITVFDSQTLEILKERHPTEPAYTLTQAFDQATGVLAKPYGKFVFQSSAKRTRVVYDRQWLLKHLKPWFDIRAVLDEAYGWQSALLLSHPKSV